MTPFYVATALVLAYPLVAALLLRATQGTRDELAAVGRELLISTSLSEDQKQFISDLLDDVFDWRFMAFSCLQFPQLVWDAARGRVERLCADDQKFLRDPRVLRFFDLHWRAVSAAAPLWTVVFLVIFTVSILLAVAFVGWSVLHQLWIDTAHHVTTRVQAQPHVHRALR